MTEMIIYTISHHTEEGQCNYCGYPMYVGDCAIACNGEMYCSHKCAGAFHSLQVKLGCKGLTYTAKRDYFVR